MSDNALTGASGAAPAAELDGFTFDKIMLLAVLTSASVLYAMAVTVANVALPDIRGALSATQDQVTLVVTFNIVATAVFTPLSGWLNARFGARNVLLYGVMGFTAASFLCGTANSLEELIIYRIAQGVFGAPVLPISQALMLSKFPQRQHATVMAIWGLGVVIGPVVAPTLGGYLGEMYSWRWIFYMLVPVGLLAIVGIFFVVRDADRDLGMRLDWVGFLSLSVAITCFQLFLDRGERLGWLDSPEIVIEIILSCGAAYIFVAHSLTASRRPFLDFNLLRNRNFSLGIGLAFAFGMLNFVPLVLFPTLLQELRGYPQSIIGLLLGARSAGVMCGFFFVALYSQRFDPRSLITAGFLLQGVAGWYMAQFDINLTIMGVAWTSALSGLGVGLVWPPLNALAFAKLQPKQIGEGAAVFHLLRNIGSSVFISLSVAVLLRSSKVSYGEAVVHISDYSERLTLPVVRGLWHWDSSQGAAMVSGEIMRQSLMIGYVNAFYLYAMVSFASISIIWLMKR